MGEGLGLTMVHRCNHNRPPALVHEPPRLLITKEGLAPRACDTLVSGSLSVTGAV